MEPVYQRPAFVGWAYPDEVRESARATALLEIRWRLQDYVGRPMTPQAEPSMQWQARAVLGRYLDILGDYWWAVYPDVITGSIIVSIVTDEAYSSPTNEIVRRRYRRVSDTGL